MSGIEPAALLANFSRMAGSRQTFETRWQELSDYLLPRHGNFFGNEVAGNNRREVIFDATGIRALQKAAAGLFSRATNPATKWFFLTTEDRELIDDEEFALWLEKVRDIMQEMINKKLSNPLFQVYKLLLGFGTTALFIEDDKIEGVVGRVFPLKDIFIAENHMSMVDTVYRRFQLTARQAVQKWGDGKGKLDAEILKANADNPDKQFSFLHCVFPRKDRDTGKKDKFNMPFASIFLDVTHKKIVSEGGFREMPYMIPRLDVIDGELFGRGPGWEAIADIKTVNTLVELIIDSANMSIRPPMDVPEGAYTTPVRLTPAALNWNQTGGQQKMSPINTFAGEVSVTFNTLDERRAAIREAFFNDQLQLINQANMTATEVLERVQQQMFLLGPWLVRLEQELFEPLIDRVFGILLRKGAFPEPPAIAKGRRGGVNLRVVYDSPLARAQRQGDVAAIDDMIAFIGNAGALSPGVADNFDFDKMARVRAETKGLPLDMLKTTDQVTFEREQDARAAAAAAEAERAEQLLAGAQGVAELPGGAPIVEQALGDISGNTPVPAEDEEVVA